MTESALDRAIGRLIWVGVRGTTPGDAVLEAEIDRCAAAHVGGVILFDVDVPKRDRLRAEGLSEPDARLGAPRNILSPDQTRGLVEHLRARLGDDLIVSVDQEGGHVSRLNARRGFAESPSPGAFARLDDAARRRAAATLAQTVASAGCDLNLAPCVDVAVNPDGPGHTALGRSFGRDPERVAALAREQIEAMRRAGVHACLKHFPGHGSARGDTHLGLVDITDTWIRDDELRPYQELKDLADAVMISHLVHRGLDPERPCSVSPRVIDGLLRAELGYDGVVVTDSLDMRAVSERFAPGEAGVLALQAGADVVLEANNLAKPAPCPAPEIHAAIRAAVEDGRLDERRVHQSAERIVRRLARPTGASA
ncbi:MAG: glycoside hydrolase family 3 N-terminal domain-containing protein [Phycisphaerales bacterium]